MSDAKPTQQGDVVSRLMSKVPKTFQACGHPFPKVNGIMHDGSGNLYEQMYTCKICGVREGFP